jgi:hypothetical protein
VSGAGWLVAAVCVLWPGQVSAQDGGFFHRLDVSGSAGYFTGLELGEADATLRGGAAAAPTVSFFTTETRLTGSPVGEARIGVWISRRLAVEGRLGYSRPALQTSVRADAEGAAPVTVVERIDQYVVDAGVLVRVDKVRVAGLVPFAAGGAGYLRQIHEGLALIEEGHVYYLGGGVNRDLMTRGHGVIRAAGLRADARVYFVSGIASRNDRTTRHGSFSAGLFVRF